ncbi:hypothetical protein [Bacillus salipaludis]|uniref:Uncharacterized protein n=1 Tax=Bacillus salipaludis TaxID=2547811 RepID=A0ABW8RC59_9BACI
MKLDDKRKKIQLKYRQEIKQQGKSKKNSRYEMVMIAVVLILIVLLVTFFADIFEPELIRIEG